MIDAAIVAGILLVLWWTCDRDARLRGTHSACMRGARRLDNGPNPGDSSATKGG